MTLFIQKTLSEEGMYIHTIAISEPTIDINESTTTKEFFSLLLNTNDCENRQVFLSYLNNDIDYNDDVEFHVFNKKHRVDMFISAIDMFDFI